MVEGEIREVRIERYYPDVLSPAKEFKAMAEAINPELKLNWQALWQQFTNTFVLSADLLGVRRWEDMLSIIPLASDTLEDRKKNILAVINATLPYTERRIHEILDALVGADSYEARVNVLAEELGIYLNTDKTLEFNKVFTLLRAIIPANLDLLIAMLVIQGARVQTTVVVTGKAAIGQEVWRFKTADDLFWDGQYTFDGSARHGGFIPIGDWENRSVHKVKFFHRIEINMSRNAARLDGAWLLNGLNALDGWGKPYALKHNLRLTPVENGVLKEAVIV